MQSELLPMCAPIYWQLLLVSLFSVAFMLEVRKHYSYGLRGTLVLEH